VPRTTALKAIRKPLAQEPVPRFFETATPVQHQAPRQAIIQGLMKSNAQLAPKFFYDVLGSHLFEAITELDEYYPTRTEAAILASQAQEIAASVGEGATLIDLGAGNCAKAMSLFGILRPARYIAVDISVEFVRRAVEKLAASYPDIAMVGVGMDFSTSLDLPAELSRELPDTTPLFFYPGSSIGNFTPAQALAFLRRIRSQASGGGLLIGVDLVKRADVLQRAYDDALGVTAAFNRNILRNVNRILGSDFDPAQWRHVALFNEVLSRVEMYLQASENLVARWDDGERRFAEGERIHTESACKYTVERFESMLREAGFRAVRHWSDAHGQYAVFHAVT
jgi:L-histidine N-alpha-methyltransferase